MRAEELKAIRLNAGWTQAQMAEALGVTPNYLATMERGERPVERRTERLIDAFARKRIDVSFSEALGKWVVAVTTPSIRYAGREHYLVAAKQSKAEAQKVAQTIWDEEGNLPMFIIRDHAV